MSFDFNSNSNKLAEILQLSYDNHLDNSGDSSAAWDAVIVDIVTAYLKVKGTRKTKSRLFRIYFLVEGLIVNQVRAERALAKKVKSKVD